MKYDLVDRRCVVTGASSGIGKEVARNLAYFGATVVLGCRDRERGSRALEEIANDSGNDRVSLVIVDMASRASIRNFVRQVTAGGSPVHVLVNNAAVMPAERRVCPDGIEITWATNVLGPFTLTNLLLPALRRSGSARVVHVASSLARGLDLEDVQFTRRRYRSIAAYGQSKQALRMLAWGLAARVPGERVSVHACHPGSVATELFREQQGWFARALRLGRAFLKSPDVGALTPTFVAADPSVQSPSGRWWIDQQASTCTFAEDREQIARLWQLCVEMAQCDAM